MLNSEMPAAVLRQYAAALLFPLPEQERGTPVL